MDPLPEGPAKRRQQLRAREPSIRRRSTGSIHVAELTELTLENPFPEDPHTCSSEVTTSYSAPPILSASEPEPIIHREPEILTLAPSSTGKVLTRKQSRWEKSKSLPKVLKPQPPTPEKKQSNIPENTQDITWAVNSETNQPMLLGGTERGFCEFLASNAADFFIPPERVLDHLCSIYRCPVSIPLVSTAGERQIPTMEAKMFRIHQELASAGLDPKHESKLAESNSKRGSKPRTDESLQDFRARSSSDDVKRNSINPLKYRKREVKPIESPDLQEKPLHPVQLHILEFIHYWALLSPKDFEGLAHQYFLKITALAPLGLGSFLRTKVRLCSLNICPSSPESLLFLAFKMLAQFPDQTVSRQQLQDFLVSKGVKDADASYLIEEMALAGYLKPNDKDAEELTIRFHNQRALKTYCSLEELHFTAPTAKLQKEPGFEYNENTFSQQFFLFEINLLRKVHFKEINYWLKGEKSMRHQFAPNLSNLTDYVNQISLWVATEILTSANLKQRTLVLKRFIHLAKNCLKIGHLDGALQIKYGLESTPIFRLKQAWAELEKKFPSSMTHFKNIQTKLSTEQNWKSLRAKSHEFRLSQQPQVPYIGIFMSDFMFSLDGSNALLFNGHFAWKRFQTLGRIHHKLYQIQNTPVIWQPAIDTSYLTFFANDLFALSNNDLMNLSLTIEPKLTKNNKLGPQDVKLPIVSASTTQSPPQQDSPKREKRASMRIRNTADGPNVPLTMPTPMIIPTIVPPDEPLQERLETIHSGDSDTGREGNASSDEAGTPEPGTPEPGTPEPETEPEPTQTTKEESSPESSTTEGQNVASGSDLKTSDSADTPDPTPTIPLSG